MKKLLVTLLTICMMTALVACSNSDADTDTSATGKGDSQNTTTENDGNAGTDVEKENAGEVKFGAYTGSASYSQGEFSMAWKIVLVLNEDGSFVLSNDAGEEKGTGTYALTDKKYSMTYSDERETAFVVNADGALEFTSELPYGKAAIGLDEVGGIVLSYYGESYEFTETEDDNSAGMGEAAATVAAGTYIGSYTKESQMAGTVVYNYTVKLGEDGSFSYAVTFDMKGTQYDGSSATGTYSIADGKFVFTDSEGSVTEGTVTGENTFVISLMASQMASDPYEVTFVPEAQ